MKITQEEKVLVAVTKKEEPPRARGTTSLSICQHDRCFGGSHMSTLPCLTLFISTLTMGHRGKGGLGLLLKRCGMSEVQGMLSLLCLSGSYSLWSE